MNEDFVTFELAKKLKEKGFKTENTDYCYLDGDLVQVKKYINISPYEYAPTISQALKWLRKEKNISIEIYSTASGWGVEIYNAGNVLKDDYSGGSFLAEIEGGNNSGRFDIYEDAALAGIKYAIDNLI